MPAEAIPRPCVRGLTISAPEQKLPGPDHPITIKAYAGRVTVKVGDRVIADTRSALRLSEASYPPVYYIPRADAEMLLLVRSDHHTYCPYKGACSYFSLRIGGAQTRNAAWSYEEPYPAVAAIKAYLAFYPDRVAIEAEKAH